MELRDYQVEIVKKGFKILNTLKILYLAMEVRTGKSLVALTLASAIKAKSVLFITKKKAISSILSDFNQTGFNYNLLVINYEALGRFFVGDSLELKTEYLKAFDLIVVDEAHSMGAFPKPSLQTQRIKKLVGSRPLIMLSGTPSPESYSQLYHQFWVSENSPFKNSNFYSFAKEFVNVKQKMINGYKINDYSRADQQKISQITDPYFLSMTQKEAGFESEVTEEIFLVDAPDYIHQLADILISERYYKMKCGSEIVCDTAAKLKSKLHQIYSGTIKTEDESRFTIDRTKAEFIKDKYHGKKIVIFYKFIQEGEILKELFPNWTNSPDCFNAFDDKTFICQIQSGAMGTNLSTADCIVFYNIDFSSLLYWQARARLMTKDRVRECPVHWVFTRGGIEEQVYKRVIKKKDFTTSYFRDHVLCQNKKFKQSA